MHFWAEYGYFLLKTITTVVAIVVVLLVFLTLLAKAKLQAKEDGKIVLRKLNDELDKTQAQMESAILSKDEQKIRGKQRKQHDKKRKKSKKSNKRLFVIDFDGDIKASAVAALREEVTAVLLAADPKRDRVLLRLESPGGMVNAYGLAASQLDRIKAKNMPLTIAVDKVAASGGYMMACVADDIIAAPFAVIGSIGVIAQLPNFHRLLAHNHVDFEQITAGEYKRTLTMFGENTDKSRKKMQAEINEVHGLFKDFIEQHRPQLELAKVATGEHWFGSQALELELVDQLQTSDDYLLAANQQLDIFHVAYKMKKQPLSKRILSGAQGLLGLLIRPPAHHGGQDYL